VISWRATSHIVEALFNCSLRSQRIALVARRLI
jgi:hypothetical protein